MLWKIISFLQDNHISIFFSCTTPVPVGYKSLYPNKPFTSISLTHLSLYAVAKFPRRLSFKDS
ncbi:uncharacterized protein METZ01_LOCUS45891 [marine metagenome]|uniref:Uncharacterized protein n=1 Tax=marine metagenome TaxID=408172 RepID=A0A381RSY5_9ZZZZ